MQQTRIFEQQIQHSIGHANTSIFGNLINGLTLTYIFRNLIEVQWLMVWYLLLFCFCAIRFVISRPSMRPKIGLANSKHWYWTYFTTQSLIGLTWGVSGMAFFIPEEIGHQFFIAIILVGTVCASVISLPVFLPIFYVFCLLVFSPLMLKLLSSDNELIVGVGLLNLVMCIYTLSAGKRLNHMIMETITARFQTEALARIDSLTGIPNRREFNERLNKEYGRAYRNKIQLALIILDIDHFKGINDNLGHLAGDAILNQVARLITESVHRPADSVARIGGEEFAVILPETHIEGTMQVAEDIRKKIQNSCIHHPASSCGDYVTISAGVYSNIPNDRLRAEILMDRADQALYKAKHAGRNCCRKFEETLIQES